MLTLQKLQISSTALSHSLNGCWRARPLRPAFSRHVSSSPFFSFYLDFFPLLIFFFSLLATDKISSCCVWEQLFLRLTYCRFSPTLLISLSLLFSFFVSLFFQLHTWHSLALIRTTPHWLAPDHTSVNILFLCSPPLCGCVPHVQLPLSCFPLYSSDSLGGDASVFFK